MEIHLIAAMIMAATTTTMTGTPTMNDTGGTMITIETVTTTTTTTLVDAVALHLARTTTEETTGSRGRPCITMLVNS